MGVGLRRLDRDRELAVCAGRGAKVETKWYCPGVSRIISTGSQAEEMAELSRSDIPRQASVSALGKPQMPLL